MSQAEFDRIVPYIPAQNAGLNPPKRDTAVYKPTFYQGDSYLEGIRSLVVDAHSREGFFMDFSTRSIPNRHRSVRLGGIFSPRVIELSGQMNVGKRSRRPLRSNRSRGGISVKTKYLRKRRKTGIRSGVSAVIQTKREVSFMAMSATRMEIRPSGRDDKA